MNNHMARKSQIGLGKRDEDFPVCNKQKAVKLVQAANKQKKPVYVPELKMTIYVMPGTDIGPIIEKHREMKAWRSKTLH